MSATSKNSDKIYDKAAKFSISEHRTVIYSLQETFKELHR
jgi:hypothetical protein